MKALFSAKPPPQGLPSRKSSTTHTGKKAGVFARSLSAYELIRSKVENEMTEKQTGSRPESKKKQAISIGLST